MPLQSVPGPVNLPADAELARKLRQHGLVEKLDACQRVGPKPVLAFEECLTFGAHTLAVLVRGVNGRIENHHAAIAAQAAAGLGERLGIVRRVVNRRVEDRKIETRIAKRQAIEIRFERRKSFWIMPCRGQPVKAVGENVDGHGRMAQLAKTVRQPAVARAEIQNIATQITAMRNEYGRLWMSFISLVRVLESAADSRGTPPGRPMAGRQQSNDDVFFIGLSSDASTIVSLEISRNAALADRIARTVMSPTACLPALQTLGTVEFMAATNRLIL